MHPSLRIASFLAIVIVGRPVGAADPFADLPDGWKVENSIDVPVDQAAAIGKKLGGDVAGLSNTVLSVDDQKIQVNLIRCRTAADAKVVYQAIYKLKGTPAAVLLRDRTVVEFVVRDVRLAIRAHYDLRFKPKSATYHVSFVAAPLETCDYMCWNELFNAFLALDRSSDAKQSAAESATSDLAKEFTFGNELRLRTHGQGPQKTAWMFDPPASDKPAGAAGTTADDSQSFSFRSLPKKAGAPAAAVSAIVGSEAFARTPAGANGPTDALTAATAYWPADDPAFQELAAEITAGRATARAKVQAIIDWLMPGQNIRYAGDVIGSRHGAAVVLKQRFGHCWDFSDLFVTLCRVAGVPTRKVGGWLFEQSGHVWAEVLCDDAGWEAVDPTAGMGCGSDYIPLITTTDGNWPLVYASDVHVEQLPAP